MPVTLDVHNPDDYDIIEGVYSYFEPAVQRCGSTRLDHLYCAGGLVERPADKFLWKLANMLYSPEGVTFTVKDMEKLKEKKAIIDANYPRDLKDAISKLYERFKLELGVHAKAKNQALRNVIETKTPLDSAPGHGPANLVREYADIKVPKKAGGSRKSKRKTRRSH
jgi:hypothetical protein